MHIFIKTQWSRNYFFLKGYGCLFRNVFTLYEWFQCYTWRMIFSSPEPKAHWQLIVYQSSRRLSVFVYVCVYVCVSVNIFKLEYLRNVYRLSVFVYVCVYVCVSVNIFKLEYLRNQWANHNQILSEASLGSHHHIRFRACFPLPRVGLFNKSSSKTSSPLRAILRVSRVHI